MLNMYRAFRTGLVDGWESPYEMSVGMSYESDYRQWLWDQGSIWGQRARRIAITWPKFEGMA